VGEGRRGREGKRGREGEGGRECKREGERERKTDSLFKRTILKKQRFSQLGRKQKKR
jgi:hypothetical protein